MKTKSTATIAKKPCIQKILTIPQCPRARDWFELIIYGNGLSGCRPILQGLSIGDGFPCSFLPFKPGEGPLPQKVVDITYQSESRIKARVHWLEWKGLYEVKVVNPRGRESNTIDLVIEEPREEKRPPVPLISPLPLRIGGRRIVKVIATIPTVSIFPQIQGFRKMEALPVGHTPSSITETPSPVGTEGEGDKKTPPLEKETVRLKINGKTKDIQFDNKPYHLPNTPYKFLYTLSKTPGKTISNEIFLSLTPRGTKEGKNISKHIQTIKDRIPPLKTLIHNKEKVGYWLDLKLEEVGIEEKDIDVERYLN